MGREKVIKAIDICLGHGKCNDCNYHSEANYSDQNCRGRMLQDVLILLKEQEPVKPDSFMDGRVQRFACKKCGKHLLYAEWGAG